MRPLAALLICTVLVAADPPRQEIPPGTSALSVASCSVEDRESGRAGRLALRAELDPAFRKPVLAWARLNTATGGDGVSLLPDPVTVRAGAAIQRDRAQMERRMGMAARGDKPSSWPSLAFAAPAALPATVEFAGEVCYEVSTGEVVPTTVALVAGQAVEPVTPGGAITARLAPDATSVVLTCPPEVWALVETAELLSADGAVLEARIVQEVTATARTMTYTPTGVPASLRLSLGQPRVLVRVPFAFTGVTIAAP